MVLRRARGYERLDRAAQAADDFTYGNQLAALTLHGLFSHVPQTRQGQDLTQIEAVDLSSIHRRLDVICAATADQRHQQSADKRTHLNQDFLFGRPGTYTIADYRLRCNGFGTAARFGTSFAAVPAFQCWPIMAFQRSQRAL